MFNEICPDFEWKELCSQQKEPYFSINGDIGSTINGDIQSAIQPMEMQMPVNEDIRIVCLH